MRARIVTVLRAALVVVCGCAHERATVPLPTAVRETPAATAIMAPRLRFAAAVADVERGGDASARIAFTELLQSYPELQDYSLAYLAAIEERAGRLADAAALLDRLLESHATSVWVARALAWRARVAAALEDPRADELALRAMTASGADETTRSIALVVRADTRAAADARAALALYQEARRVGGHDAAVARAHSDALIAAHPEVLDESDLLLAEGTQLLREGRLEDAALRLEAAAGALPDRSERAAALRSLARVRQRQGRLTDAIEIYRDAAAAEPPPAVLSRFDLATLLWNRDRDDEAAVLFIAIAREAPRHAKADDAHYALGRIAEHAGRRSEAAAEYRRVIAAGANAALVREARWRLAWGAYEDRRWNDAATAFVELGRASPQDQAAALYWEGRIRERRDGGGAGEALYRAVLDQAPETYYAELSEGRLLESAPPPPPPVLLTGDPPESLRAHAYHWNRGRELHAIALDEDAGRELAAIGDDPTLASGAESFLMEAYREVDAHGRALRLASRLASTNSIPRPTLTAYLYPRAYWPLVSDRADAERLDAYLVLALMRQESLFDPEAVSPAAAYGLMQLIIPTAETVAGGPVTAAQLTDPRLNVALGTRYLRQLLDRYGGELPKALAAYNAGQDAVAKWEARAPGSASDEFVERISFRETRSYVKNVLGNYRRYRRLYGAPGERRAATLDATDVR